MELKSKPHGNTGNRNAAKEDGKDSFLKVRCHSQQKSGYVKTARRQGMKLSEWVLKTLDEASDY